MRNYLLPLLGILILSACSTPRYTYNFDYYNYNAGKKKAETAKVEVVDEAAFVPAPAEAMVASTNTAPVVLEKASAPIAETKAAPAAPRENKSTMTREEEKALKKEMKKELKSAIKSAKKASASMDAPGATKAMDNDLKLAIIFGAVGLVLSLFGGVSGAFWVLSVIAFVIAVVFLVKWLVRQ